MDAPSRTIEWKNGTKKLQDDSPKGCLTKKDKKTGRSLDNGHHAPRQAQTADAWDCPISIGSEGGGQAENRQGI